MRSVLRPTDPGYPASLLGERAPPVLRVRGSLPGEPGVAVVGKRDASPAALEFTRTLVEAIASAGFAVWSGGAFGVDAAAHEAAMAARAPTVVVLGGGLDRASPAEHADMFERVLREGGAHVSLVADDAPATRPGFLARNVVLAAFTVATVVVEAGARSGALSTAAAARRFGRPVLVVPHAPWEPRGVGCLRAIASGAKMVTSPNDVLLALGAAPLPAVPPLPRTAKAAPGLARAAAPPPTSTRTLGGDERLVLDALSGEAVHVDVVCERARLPPNRVAAALMRLSLEALVVEESGGFRRA